MKNIGKKVITMSDGNVFGYVLDVCLDELFEKSGYYVVEDESEEVMFLPLESALEIGDAIMVQSQEDLHFVGSEKRGLMGKEVYDNFGNFYGNVTGVEFVKNRLFKLCTNKCEIMKKHIKNLTGNVILCSFIQKRTVKNRKIFHTNQDVSVSILSADGASFSKPEKVSLSSKFYIGKSAYDDVFGYNNERIVKRGEKITKSIFENVKKHNKLNELFFVLKV